MFNRFWRADPARARTTGGTGLGLSIALEDARLHGGWLQAWGEPGDGSHFRLTLPRRAGRPLRGSPLPLVPEDAARGEGAVAVAATSDGTAVVAAVAEVPGGDVDRHRGHAPRRRRSTSDVPSARPGALAGGRRPAAPGGVRGRAGRSAVTPASRIEAARVQPFAIPPTSGDTPDGIVRGFLAAGKDFHQNHQVAREYIDGGGRGGRPSRRSWSSTPSRASS